MRRLKVVAVWIVGAIALLYVGSAAVIFAVMRVGPFGFEAAPLREALARLAPAPKGST
jgi:hypothetical protein